MYEATNPVSTLIWTYNQKQSASLVWTYHQILMVGAIADHHTTAKLKNLERRFHNPKYETAWLLCLLPPSHLLPTRP